MRSKNPDITTMLIRRRVDRLSAEAKGWLHRTCQQLADTGEYATGEGKKECIKAGIVEDKRFGRIMVSAEVMSIVYSEAYLKEFKDK